eukprot:COSAG06_NODE_44017_length_367_cov_0.552239_2_plen_54_part_01
MTYSLRSTALLLPRQFYNLPDELLYSIDGEILGSIISGDGSSLPAVVARLGIGR